MTEINTPEELEALPDGKRIKDSGLVATKINGAWHYTLGAFEPENFPVVLLDE